jgi:hypothetical protein
MHSDVPDGQCALCGGLIAEVECDLHWTNADRTGGFGYSGRCLPCDVDYSAAWSQAGFTGWTINAPDPSALTARAEESELETVSRKLQRYRASNAKWQAFLNRRREGDEVWRTEIGFAMVRRGLPVSAYPLPFPHS